MDIELRPIRQSDLEQTVLGGTMHEDLPTAESIRKLASNKRKQIGD